MKLGTRELYQPIHSWLGSYMSVASRDIQQICCSAQTGQHEPLQGRTHAVLSGHCNRYIRYMYVDTCPTSVHVSPHDIYMYSVHTVHVYLNIKVEVTVVSCRITCPLLSSHL